MLCHELAEVSRTACNENGSVLGNHAGPQTPERKGIRLSGGARIAERAVDQITQSKIVLLLRLLPRKLCVSQYRIQKRPVGKIDGSLSKNPEV